MPSSAIATRYATALVDAVLAHPGPDPAATGRELRAFSEAVRDSPDLRNALEAPSVPVPRKRSVIGQIGEIMQASVMTRNFLLVVSDHHRLGWLAEMSEAFDRLLEERLGFVRAEISSPAELSAEQQASLADKLERLTGKRVRMSFRMDPELLGGVVARIGSTVYDGSVRGQLNALGKRLSAAG